VKLLTLTEAYSSWMNSTVPKRHLEGLRTVLDSRTVLASYGSQRLTWPADFLLVATSNHVLAVIWGIPRRFVKILLQVLPGI